MSSSLRPPHRLAARRTVLLLALCGGLALTACKSDDAASPITGEMGKVRGPCYPNLTCNAGLSCLSEVCVRLNDGGFDSSREAGEGGVDEASVRDAGGPDATPCISGCATTVAGSGVAGFAEGQALTAQLNGPTGLAFDDKGRLLIADRDNHRVRVLEKDGTLATLAGSGTPGFANGPALAAQLQSPSGLAFGAGKLYIADSGNNRIRVLVSGELKTYASSGEVGGGAGYNDLQKATFNSPRGVTRDGWGTVFVGDTGNGSLREVSALGAIVVSKGRRGIWGVAVDSLGSVYFAASEDHRIYRYAAANTTLFAGADTRGYLDGRVAAARFNAPRGIYVFDSGEVLVADTNNHRIRRIVGDQVSTIAGEGPGYADGPLADVRFNGPSDVIVGPNGDIYVADTNNHRIRVVRP